MTRRDSQRLTDITTAVAAIRAHLSRGDMSDALIFDAVRVRLIEIGEAVKALDLALLASEPTIPWAKIAGMRDQLAHHYFDTSHAIVTGTVHHDLPELEQAVERLTSRLTQQAE
ncbi:MAG TPA: HepT-like ribonuclease domain-containing protein [Mycobacteriales bacterium]|nr:HepT-like ribonuclease domain-containing protein [Mycobacteriales bacterium]